MDEESLKAQVGHLRQVEKLSLRQIARTLAIDRKKVRVILRPESPIAKALPVKGLVDKYIPLIAQWYKQYPNLQGKQIYQRLQGYGYKGSYKTVLRACFEYRQPKETAYHVLNFLPGQEAQVDWFSFKHERLEKECRHKTSTADSI